MNRRWTLLLVRDESHPVQQFTLDPRALRYAGGALVALLLVLGVVVVMVGAGGTARFEAERLRARNVALQAELQEVRTQVASLDRSVEDLTRRDAELRTLAGLDPTDPEVLEVGVGGPGLETPEAHPLYAFDPELGEDAFAVAWDVDALERRIRLLDQSMDQAGDSLQAHHDLLQSTPSILPTAGLLSSRFSRSRVHPIHHRAVPHEGIDVSAPEGTPILASARGRVVRAGWVSGYGRMVEIDHGYGYTTRYGHASTLLVRVGETVERGDVIARVGNTGLSTASHLHYEVRVNGQPQNPMNYVLPDVVP